MLSRLPLPRPNLDQEWVNLNQEEKLLDEREFFWHSSTEPQLEKGNRPQQDEPVG